MTENTKGINWGRTRIPLIVWTITFLLGYFGMYKLLLFGVNTLPQEHILFYLIACIWCFVMYCRNIGYPDFYFK